MTPPTDNGFVPPATAREAALFYHSRGVAVVPLPPRSKDPGFTGWTTFRFDASDLDVHFPEGQPRNVAALNGEPSGRLADVDLDCDEARAAAPRLLPKTGWIFGRKTAPKSHYTYRTSSAFPSAKKEYADPLAQGNQRGAVLCELRGTNGITVMPPGLHKETGEPITWDRFEGGPAEVPLPLLMERVGDVAVVSLLARHWPGRGRRDDCFLALAGGLVRHLDVVRAERIIDALAAVTDDEETAERVKKAQRTADRLVDGGKAVGWPKLAEHLGEHGEVIVRRACEWLGVGQRAEGEPWPDPIPLPAGPPSPPTFPIDALPPEFADFVRCQAEATQTPPDLAAVLVLVAAGAGLARKYRAQVRPGWPEPLNLFGVAALPSGERKSAVYREALAPVYDFERAEAERMAPLIAEAQSERRQLEARLKHLENTAAKAEKEDDRADANGEAKRLAAELAAHDVPPEPKLVCDNVTPDEVERLLCEQGGRLLQAAPEGTIFDVIKGRYDSKGKENFDVYLKGHAGDPLRTDRVIRGRTTCDEPALSVAVCVQPHVIRGLAEKEALRGKGMLARFLYSIPASMVGRRAVAPRPLPEGVRQAYRGAMLALWRATPGDDGSGGPIPRVLVFSAEADRVIQFLESWLEPQLGEGGELSWMAGWANKLAGACARIAGILHVAAGQDERTEVSGETAAAAVRIGRDYFLPHAQAAFHLLGSSERHHLAARMWENVRRKVASVASVAGEGAISRKNLFDWNRRLFPEGVEKMDGVVKVLVDHYHLRQESDGGKGRGVKGATFTANPKALSCPPHAQRTQRTQPPPEDDPPAGKPDDPGPESGRDGPRAQRPQPAQPCGAALRGKAVNGHAGQTGGEVAPVAYVAHAEAAGAAGSEFAQDPDELRTLRTVRTGEGTGPAGAPSDPVRSLLARTSQELECVLSALEEADSVALDAETTGLDPSADRVRLLQLTLPTTDCGHAAYLIDCFAVDPAPVLQALAGKELVGHNLTFDLAFLARLGFEPSGAVHDTMHLSRVLHAGASYQIRHGLADCVGRELGEAMDKTQQRSDWSGALTPGQLDYAARDVLVLPRLLEALRRKLREVGLDRTAEIESRCLPAVAWMTAKGVAVDRDAWRELIRAADGEAERLKQEMAALAPVPPGEMFVSWKWDSPADLKRLFATLGFPVENTDDSTLAGVSHPIAGLLRRYREATKRSSTYGGSWLKNVRADGRVYARWNQTGSEAGRMSCGEPNMQQLPRDKAYRRCVAAPPGRVLVKADYSQIELRIAAKVSGDEALLKAYRDGADVHRQTAQRVLGKEEVTKEDRQLAKALNFGLIYGMSARGFAAHARGDYGLELSEEQAEKYLAAFFQTYGGLRAWHRRVKRERAPETRTLAGRRRLFGPPPAGKTDAEKRKYEAALDRQRLNTPVQGTGADGLKLALALLWERRAEAPGAFPVLAVHDEIVVECDEARAEAAVGWLRGAMLVAMAPLIDPIPVEVDVKVGRTWAG